MNTILPIDEQIVYDQLDNNDSAVFSEGKKVLIGEGDEKSDCFWKREQLTVLICNDRIILERMRRTIQHE